MGIWCIECVARLMAILIGGLMDSMNERKQRAAEQIVAEIEELHRLRIHKKIRLTRRESNEETMEFLQRVAAAGVKRVMEIQMELDRSGRP